MEEFRRIQAIDLDFFPRDLYLINKNAEKFLTLTTLYENLPLDNLIVDFLKHGNKRFKTSTMRLKFLAIYHAILNHNELLPSGEALQNLVNNEISKKAFNYYAESQNKQEKEIFDSNANLEIEVKKINSNGQEEYVELKNYDIQHKWARITSRLEEVRDYIEQMVQDAVYDYEQFHNDPEKEVYVPPRAENQVEDYMFR